VGWGIGFAGGQQKAVAKVGRWFRGRCMWPAVRGDRVGLLEILGQPE
jgi:hypothetical protein